MLYQNFLTHGKRRTSSHGHPSLDLKNGDTLNLGESLTGLILQRKAAKTGVKLIGLIGLLSNRHSGTLTVTVLL